MSPAATDPSPSPDPSRSPGPPRSAPIEVEVAIVGAGPAGTAAAIELGRSGIDVLVVDKARFPRDKTCGDGLTTLALRQLDELGLDPAAVASWRVIDGAVLHSPAGREVPLPLPDGPGWFAAVARRVDLDAALVELARAAGARVVEGATLRGAALHHGRPRLEVEGLGTVEAGAVIGADGMWSPLRRFLGLDEPEYRGDWHAFRQYFTGAGPRAASELHVWFEPDLLPGYAWSFPLADGRINVGFGVMRGGALDGGALKRLWPDLLARPAVRDVLGPEARPEDHHRAWPIPARVHRASAGAGPVVLVGDAVAATDLLTGEGIGQALLTGRLAAAAVLESGLGPDATADLADRYRTALHHHLVPDHRMAATLSRVMASSTRAEWAIRTVAVTDWTRRSFARWLFEDSPRGIALTPRRWRRGALHGDGAYRFDRSRPRHGAETRPT